MKKRLIKCKWIYLLLWWGCGLAVFLSWGINNKSTVQKTQQAPSVDWSFDKNCMKAFSHTHCDPENAYRPLHSVSFDELKLDNGKLGIFNTGIYKVAKIKGLHLAIHTYSTGDNKLLEDNILCGISSRLLEDISFESIQPWKSSGLLNEVEFTIGLPDVRSVAEVRIENFNYKISNDNREVLKINCKRAHASLKQKEVVLRGHVIITAAHGRLESNHIKWDMKNNQFTADGSFVLSKNEKREFGRNVCFDKDLNIIRSEHTKVNIMKEKKCYTKL